MSIENLVKVLPPPTEPTGVFDGPWDVVERQLRTRLPQDYKDLIRLYGWGQFVGHFRLFHPIEPSGSNSLVPAVLRIQRSLADDPTVPIYPRPGGLLACGLTYNGEYICWLTRGATPEEWPIVVWDVRPRSGEEFKTFECDLTDFIADILTTGVFPWRDDQENIDWVRAQKPFEAG